MLSIPVIGKTYPYRTMGVIFGTIAFLLIIADISFGTLSKKDLYQSIAWLGFATASMLITVSSLLSIQLELRMRDIKGEQDVMLIDSPVIIWRRSIEILDELCRSGITDQHGYDVSTYLNKFAYEQAVCSVLGKRVRFRRLFCFPKGSKINSDRAIELFHSCIVDGNEIKKEDMKGFEGEFVKIFEEKTSGATELTNDQLRSLNSLIAKLHGFYKARVLDIKSLDYHLHFDFVAVQYRKGPKGHHFRLMANFKTDPDVDTYVTGTTAEGDLAKGYIDLFNNILR